MIVLLIDSYAHQFSTTLVHLEIAMKVYTKTLSLILVQSVRAEDPSYFPTVVWDDNDDDVAGSSNLGIESNVTVWPTYSPGPDYYYDDETDDYAYYYDDEADYADETNDYYNETDDFSYSNHTHDDYSYEKELDRYDSSSITEVHVVGDHDSNLNGSSAFTAAASISESNSNSERKFIRLAALAPLAAIVYML